MLLVAFVSASLVTLAVVLAIERYAAMVGLIDRPNDRSSHVAARPRGGGLGIIGGVAAGLLVLLASGESFDVKVWSVLGGACLVAAVGLWDDVVSVSPRLRLIVQMMAAGAVVWVCGGVVALPFPAPLDMTVGPAGSLLTIVWIVGVTNFFNFMDGADGLASGQSVLTFLLLAIVLWPGTAAVVPLLVVAATVAFLVRNWAPARIFLGDVGSGWIGFLLAAWPLVGPIERREQLILMVATSLALFLLDPVTTLARRWRRGAELVASHREHAYQRLFTPGQSHARVVGLLLVGTLVLSCAAFVAYEWPRTAWGSVALALGLFAVEWGMAARPGRSLPFRIATDGGEDGRAGDEGGG